MRAFTQILIAICAIAFIGCATEQPVAKKAPQLSQREELAAFKAILQYKLAQAHFPRHSIVYVEALEIFPSERPRPAPVQALSAGSHEHKIIVTSEDRFTSDLWFKIYLNSTDGTTFYFSVQDHDRAETFRMQKRDSAWIVVGIDPVIVT